MREDELRERRNVLSARFERWSPTRDSLAHSRQGGLDGGFDIFRSEVNDGELGDELR
jgi:hypothetical protein